MALLKQNQALTVARDAIIARSALVVKSSNHGRSTDNNGAFLHAFIEHPTAPLNDADRDVFLTLLDDNSAPNEALRSGAEWFKTLGI